MSKRKKIPRIVKNFVSERQNYGCAICPNRLGLKHYHHVDPVFFKTENKDSCNNIILLCIDCHMKLHLADPETCMKVYEYAYYLQTGGLPEDPYSLITAQAVIDMIRNS